MAKSLGISLHHPVPKIRVGGGGGKQPGVGPIGSLHFAAPSGGGGGGGGRKSKGRSSKGRGGGGATRSSGGGSKGRATSKGRSGSTSVRRSSGGGSSSSAGKYGPNVTGAANTFDAAGHLIGQGQYPTGINPPAGPPGGQDEAGAHLGTTDTPLQGGVQGGTSAIDTGVPPGGNPQNAMNTGDSENFYNTAGQMPPPGSTPINFGQPQGSAFNVGDTANMNATPAPTTQDLQSAASGVPADANTMAMNTGDSADYDNTQAPPTNPFDAVMAGMTADQGPMQDFLQQPQDLPPGTEPAQQAPPGANEPGGIPLGASSSQNQDIPAAQQLPPEDQQTLQAAPGPAPQGPEGNPQGQGGLAPGEQMPRPNDMQVSAGAEGVQPAEQPWQSNPALQALGPTGMDLSDSSQGSMQPTPENWFGWMNGKMGKGSPQDTYVPRGSAPQNGPVDAEHPYGAWGPANPPADIVPPPDGSTPDPRSGIGLGLHPMSPEEQQLHDSRPPGPGMWTGADNGGWVANNQLTDPNGYGPESQGAVRPQAALDQGGQTPPPTQGMSPDTANQDYGGQQSPAPVPPPDQQGLPGPQAPGNGQLQFNPGGQQAPSPTDAWYNDPNFNPGTYQDQGGGGFAGVQGGAQGSFYNQAVGAGQGGQAAYPGAYDQGGAPPPLYDPNAGWDQSVVPDWLYNLPS